MVGKPIGGGVPVAAYGMTAEVADRLCGPDARPRDRRRRRRRHADRQRAGPRRGVRARCRRALREEDFAVAIPLAERFTAGVAAVIAEHGLPWHVQRLGCRAEYWFCPPPRDGAAAAAAVDEELEGFLHLWASTAACC